MLTDLNIQEVLFIDIETVPVVPEYNMLPESWQKQWEHKMQFKIDEGEIASDLYERAGIYAEFGRIVCISAGHIVEKQGERLYRVKSFSDSNEKKLIQDFFEVLEKFGKNHKLKLCAHNGYEFDFPYISRRALVNGVKLPKILSIAGAKPWELKDHLIDTLQLWKFGDFKHYTSLSLLCELFQIPTPKDDIDGSQVARVYWQEDNLERIVKYCEKDTLAVANLLLRYLGKDIILEEDVQEVN